MPIATTRTLAPSPWQRSKGRRLVRSDAAAMKEWGGKRKRATSSFHDEEGRETKKRSSGEETEASSEEEQKEVRQEEGEEQVEETSSEPSSPLCEPYIEREAIGSDSDGVEVYKATDPETFKTYNQKEMEFREKLRQKMELATLDASITSNFLRNPKLRHLAKDATKAALCTGRYVFALTSSIGGEDLSQGSGFLFDRDKDGAGLILTSAYLLCSKQPSLDSWLCLDEYALDAEVTVHLPDKSALKAQLRYLQKHYNIAIFSAKLNMSCGLPSFEDNVNSNQEVFMFGRDCKSNIMISHGQVQHLNPTVYERYHFMYTYGAAPECGIGGPVVNFEGSILGMSTPDTLGSFVPTSIITKWMHLWKEYECIPRPHLQLKFSGIKFLDPVQIERIYLDCGIENGLIVKEVSTESFAEKHGIRVGDVVETLNGRYVSSTVELEILLLGLSEEHLRRGNENNSQMNVEIGMFRTRKDNQGVIKNKRRTIKMMLDVTDQGEKVVRGSYPVTVGKVVSSSVLHEQVDPGSPDSPASIGASALG